MIEHELTITAVGSVTYPQDDNDTEE